MATFASKSGAFFLTFWSFALLHACRKSFSAVKSEMSREGWFESSLYDHSQQAKMAGVLDTLFLALYAMGLYVSGMLADEWDLRKILSGGMGLTAAIVLAFGLGAFVDIHALSFYATLWAANGLVQSSGLPANVAVMGKWFGHDERGAAFGLWSGNACLGNILGTAMVAMMFELMDRSVAWKAGIVLTAVCVGLHGLLMHVYLVPSPADAPYRHQKLDVEEPVSPSVETAGTEEEGVSPRPSIPQRGISFCEAWLVPGVIPYSLSYACLKSVNYALFFWLPFYLTANFHMENSKADAFSMLYDAGQIVGGFIGGYISDYMGVRAPVLVGMLLCSFFTIYSLHTSTYGATGFLLFSSGFMLGGPANLISTAISADLGTHKSIRGDSAALATVTGIIDGTGSIGAALVQYLVGYLSNCHREPAGCDPRDPHCVEVCSWGPVFVLLEVGVCMACVFLLPLLYHDVIRLRLGTHRDRNV